MSTAAAAVGAVVAERAPAPVGAAAKGKCQVSTSKGYGKGKGPPPPPTGEAAAKVRADLEAQQQKIREFKKREALENVEKAKALEAAKRDLSSRLHLLTPLDISDVNWSELRLGLHLEGGRGGQQSGVRLMEFEGGRALCLRKQHLLFPTEIVADRVAAAMKVPVAKFRLVHPDLDKDEFDLIERENNRIEPPFEEMAKFDKYLEQLKETDPEQYKRTKKLVEPGTVALLEFVSGVNLDRAPESLITGNEKLMHDLGRLCALDTLLNNLDRLPLPLWDNAGNLSNVMLRMSGDVVGIDQQVNTPADSAGCERYLGRVRSLVRQICGVAPSDGEDAKQSPAAISERLRRAIKEACNIELSKADLIAINDGLRSGLADAVACVDSGALRTSLDDAITLAGRRVKHSDDDARPHPAADAKRHADFVMLIAREVATIFRECT